MKKTFVPYSLSTIYASFFLALMGCRDITVQNRPYQRLIIDDFSVPIRSSLPVYDGRPTSLTLRVSGTISKPVILTVEELGESQARYPIRRDTLQTGVYADKKFSGDHYSSEALELLVTSADSTVGNLTIDWYRQ